MQAQIIFNSKCGKFEGFHLGKIVSRCATADKVRACLNKLGYDDAHINESSISAHVNVKVKDPSIRQWLEEKVAEVVDQANAKHSTTLKPAVKFYSTGTHAGQAHYRDMSVSFNEVLASENKSQFLNTVIHEVAHLVVRQRYPFANAHGQEFKSVMWSLGGSAARCHSYDVQSVKRKVTVKRYICNCACQEHRVTKRIALRPASFHCRKCKSPLTYTGKAVLITK